MRFDRDLPKKLLFLGLVLLAVWAGVLWSSRLGGKPSLVSVDNVVLEMPVQDRRVPRKNLASLPWRFVVEPALQEGPVARATGQVLRALEQHYVDPSRLDAARLLAVAVAAIRSEAKDLGILVLELGSTDDSASVEANVRVCLEEGAEGPVSSCAGGSVHGVSDQMAFGEGGPEQKVALLLAERAEGILLNLPSGTRPSAALSKISAHLLQWLSDLGLDPEHNLFRAYLNAILHELDPHSSFLSPSEYEELRGGTRGQFGGVGVVISQIHGLPFVKEIVPNSPAQMAGIEPNDIVLRVGDVSVAFEGIGMALREIRSQSAGGQPVPLWLFRPHSLRVFNTFISREDVPTVSVEERHIPEAPEVLHLRVTGFSSRTSQEIYDAYMGALKRRSGSLEALILDLRGNPGGLLDQAIQVSDLFLSEGTIVETRSRYESEKETASSEQLISLPVVVLINSSSASASEIVAGALKDSGRALVIGEQSFGKGSVQSLFEVPDFGALKLTVAHYLTPSGRSIQNRGVLPHVSIRQVQTKAGHIWVAGSSEKKREQDLTRHLRNPTPGMMESSDQEASKLIWTRTSEAFSEEVFPGHVAFAFPNEENADRLTDVNNDGSVRVALGFLEAARKTPQGVWSLPELDPEVFREVFERENTSIGRALDPAEGAPLNGFFADNRNDALALASWNFRLEEGRDSRGQPSFKVTGHFADREAWGAFKSSSAPRVLVGFSQAGETEQPSLWTEVPVTVVPDPGNRALKLASLDRKGLAALAEPNGFRFEFGVPPLFWTAWSALDESGERGVELAVRLSPFGAPTHLGRWQPPPEIARHEVATQGGALEIDVATGEKRDGLQSYKISLHLNKAILGESDHCEVIFVPLTDRTVEVESQADEIPKEGRVEGCQDSVVHLRIPIRRGPTQGYNGIVGALVRGDNGLILARRALVEIGPRGLERLSP